MIKKLRKIAELQEKATPGPWYAYDLEGDEAHPAMPDVVVEVDDEEANELGFIETCSILDDLDANDALFIAAARSIDFAALLELVRAVDVLYGRVDLGRIPGGYDIRKAMQRVKGGDE